MQIKNNRGSSEPQNALSMLECSVDSNLGINFLQTNSIEMSDYTTTTNMTCWKYWQDYYYPWIVRESYPVYIQEKSLDRGRHAYEIIKILKDKKLIEIKTVKQFCEIMDELIKIL